MDHLVKVFVFSVLTIFLIGCGERQADLENTNRYENNGISFSYPGNWKVTEDVESDGYRYLFIESPGDAIVRVEIYPIDESFQLEEFVKLSIDGFKSEMPMVFKVRDNSEIIDSQHIFENRTLNGFKYEFNLSVLELDVPHVTEYYMFQSKTESAYLSNQAALEDLGKVKDGFSEVLRSFHIKNALKKVSN